jgi:hypothetical protein
MKNSSFSVASLSTRRWRNGPGGLAEMSDIALERFKAPATKLFERRPYRPKTLRSIMKTLSEHLGVK